LAQLRASEQLALAVLECKENWVDGWSKSIKRKFGWGNEVSLGNEEYDNDGFNLCSICFPSQKPKDVINPYDSWQFSQPKSCHS